MKILLKSITPSEYKEIGKNDETYIQLNDREFYDIENITSKQLYNMFITLKYTVPTGVKRWLEKIPNLNQIEDEQWERIFLLPTKTIRE